MIQMRLSWMVMGAVVVVVKAATRPCPDVCFKVYAPVCGSDGRTYGNSCMLDKASCKDPSITLKHNGVCKARTTREACPTICPAIYEPQCGSDGKTYGNECVLEIDMCKNQNLYLKHPGRCRATPRPCPDACPLNYDPMCGSDGNTYSNDCKLGVASCNDPSITMNHRGECQATPRPCPDACPLNYDPMCGSDGKTYTNDCQLDVASCKDPSITMNHRGECQAPPQQCSILCNKNLDPMCGSDGITYGNPCFLRLATCYDSSITLRHEGRCAAPTTPPHQCPQVCPFNYDPVCGSDGKTYGNDCQLGITSCNDPSITLKHKGLCQATTHPCPIACTRIYMPMCGSDGKTYENGCALDIASCHDPSITLKYDGRCEAPPQQCPRSCTLEYNPMCGSDGKTYDNPCDLRREACYDSSLTLRHKGRCTDNVDECEGRICSDLSYQPVCGSDGRTYKNNCTWANAACGDRTLTIKHTGVCQRPTKGPPTTPPTNTCGPRMTCSDVDEPYAISFPLNRGILPRDRVTE